MDAPASAADEIKRRARALGFDLVGCTRADPPPHAARFEQWLADGFHGDMQYLARRAAERGSLQQLLPGARSVVVVGMNYFVDAEALTEQGPPGGRVARYAWGTGDYHEILGEKLDRLAAAIRAVGGPAIRTRWFVDTGPVLERDLAQRAGIGFIGKHTNLIHRGLGNWIFVGEVLTDLELSPDPPEREYCGTCHRCLDACPTRAIVAPYRLDARLCISYLTIELKGSIPVELRPLVGDRIFGCDDCLEVCPWNRFARASTVREFQRRPLPPLTEFLGWTDRQFRDYFRGTPLLRLKRPRFLRNVCVALGNCGGAEALPALTRALQDPDPLVREHAAWAIAQIRARRPSPSER